MNILIDTGVWYAYWDKGDPYHNKAQNMVQYLSPHHNIIFPFPVLYETLNTKFCKNTNACLAINNILSRESCSKIFDEKYRDNALRLALNNGVNRNRPMSLVDIIIRLILDDPNIKVDALITFNIGDFSDLCDRKFIEIKDS